MYSINQEIIQVVILIRVRTSVRVIIHTQACMHEDTQGARTRRHTRRAHTQGTHNTHTHTHALIHALKHMHSLTHIDVPSTNSHARTHVPRTRGTYSKIAR